MRCAFHPPTITVGCLRLDSAEHERTAQALEVLSSYLSPVVHDTDNQGWEEVTDCSLTSMLRSALSKKDMANNIVQLESVSEIPEDGSRLQKVRQLSRIRK
jgi:hypothetical protein